MRAKKILLALIFSISGVGAAAQDYVITVSGFVCEFCAIGVSKNVSKLSFVDRTRFDKGVLMDSENQRVTIAVGEGETFDFEELNDAIESGGYKVERIHTVSALGEQIEVMP